MEATLERKDGQEFTVLQAGLPGLLGSVLVGAHDAGQVKAIPLAALIEPLVLAERLHATDRLDARNARVQATIAAGAAVGATARGTITVPEGEVWFVQRMQHISPAESGVGVGDIVQTNIRLSKWVDPAGDTDGKPYNEANIGTAALNTTNEDLTAVDELGAELRLVGGDKLTLVAVLTGAAAGANLTATLTLFGRKGKRLV